MKALVLGMKQAPFLMHTGIQRKVVAEMTCARRDEQGKTFPARLHTDTESEICSRKNIRYFLPCQRQN